VLLQFIALPGCLADLICLPFARVAAHSKEAWIMIDRKRTGMRCGAKKIIRNHKVTIQPANQGTILYEVENLGRKLILVQWDGKSSTYAFPEDLEITSTRKSHNHFAK
jgi:hypothetical protein